MSIEKDLTKLIWGVFGTLVAAGIIANLAMFFDIKERLVRLETKFEMFDKPLAKNKI